MYIPLIPGATYEPPGRAIPRFGVWNMKHTLIAAAALSMLVTPALAGSQIEKCTAMAEMAKSAMELRQMGADLASVVGDLSDALDGAELNMAIELMQIVYSQPLFSSDRAKESAANEFSSEMFRVCMEEEE